MKVWFVGIWVALVALGAAYGVAVFMPPPSSAKAAGAATTLVAQKTRVISVPMIADGSVQGFISMQFAYTVDAAVLKTLKVPPEIYLLDEAFRAVYTDETLDFRHLEKYDLKKLTIHLIQSTNAHLGVPLVKEILIDNFTYVDKDQKD
ncbi:MAG TPA: hypothetical protein VH414_07660 [Lichenihabitans sp.]|jgi:hypothetical protein|nr:hypothetical protein [Lichenihabitans sp.]